MRLTGSIDLIKCSLRCLPLQADVQLLSATRSVCDRTRIPQRLRNSTVSGFRLPPLMDPSFMYFWNQCLVLITFF